MDKIDGEIVKIQDNQRAIETFFEIKTIQKRDDEIIINQSVG